MKSTALFPASASMDKRTLRRIALLAATLIAVVGTLLLLRAVSSFNVSRVDQTIAQAWQTSGSTSAKRSIDAVAVQWGMQRQKSADQNALAWSVADMRDLRASLLALDSTQTRIQKISVTKRDAGFAVTAELGP
jgi:hypothetical protein